MEDHPDFVSANEIKRRHVRQEEEIGSKLTALHKLESELREEVVYRFTVLEDALKARKAHLLEQIDKQVSSIKKLFEETAAKVNDSIKISEQLINTATQVYSIMPSIALSSLQPLKTLPALNMMLPTVKGLFCSTLESDIKHYGEIVIVGQLTTLAGSESSGYVDGNGQSALFNFPEKSVVNPLDGCCYVSEYYNHRIRRITPQGEVSTFAGTGDPGWEDGPCSSAKFDRPGGIAVNNKTGDLFLCDYGNNMIRKISPDGEVSTYAGNGVFDSKDGDASSASFCNPWGLDVNQNDGSLYVIDYSSHQIRKVSSDGVVSTVAGTKCGFLDGDVSVAKFNSPYGIAVHHETGDVYIADGCNHRIRKISEGNVTTVAGTGVAGSRDGEKHSASFFRPFDVKIDERDGSLFVSEFNGNKMRKITTTGTVSTLCWLTEDGDKVSSEIKGPKGLSFDQKNHVLYIACHGHKIMRIFIP